MVIDFHCGAAIAHLMRTIGEPGSWENGVRCCTRAGMAVSARQFLRNGAGNFIQYFASGYTIVSFNLYRESDQLYMFILVILLNLDA
jgi:hypothetical protein